MLGMLFKCVHGMAHQDLQILFPRKMATNHMYVTKLQAHRHHLQLHEERPGTHHALLRRSVFGLTRVWNRLPKDLMATRCVTTFQIFLTALVREACEQGEHEWDHLLSPRPPVIRETIQFEKFW